MHCKPPRISVHVSLYLSGLPRTSPCAPDIIFGSASPTLLPFVAPQVAPTFQSLALDVPIHLYRRSLVFGEGLHFRAGGRKQIVKIKVPSFLEPPTHQPTRARVATDIWVVTSPSLFYIYIYIHLSINIYRDLAATFLLEGQVYEELLFSYIFLPTAFIKLKNHWLTPKCIS